MNAKPFSVDSQDEATFAHHFVDIGVMQWV